MKKAPAPRKGKAADTGKSSEMLALVLESLEEDKAEDVVSIDLTGKTPIADHMVVASGRSQRHVGAVADHLLRRLKEAGFGNAQVEGMKQGDWVLIDGGDVVVHVFRPEVRDFYKLEKMWSADIPADQLAV
ncbi:ribosome silencing factor [Parvibaculum sp.]|uniref:ribosome silencing factor n=1 Tax=Parvibaculum sp. TaxID=2024848 RepID=UPI00391C93FC